MKREVYWIGGVNEENLNKTIEAIRKLQKENNESIRLYVKSEGGALASGRGFYDWVRSKNIQLETIGIGKVGSAAILVFLAGQKRKATKNAIFLIHGLARKYEETFNLIQTEEIASEFKLEYKYFSKILAEETKIPEKESSKILRGKKYLLLTAEKAKEKGLIHEIIS